MEAPRLYKDGNVWTYSDGMSNAIKTAPAGNYRRLINGNEVAVFGKNNYFSLFKPVYYEVTKIQKSATPNDFYVDIAEFIGATEDFFVSPSGTGGTSIISRQVVAYADLPTAAVHTGEICYVETNSGGMLSWLGIYKYPKGFYSPNSSDLWEIVPLNVKVAEDALTLVSISSWTEYFNFAQDIGIGDRVLFNNKQYYNKTGVQTGVSPPFDETNWSPTNEISWLYPYDNTTQAKGVMTRIDGWTTLSNKLTSEYPTPQNIGGKIDPYTGTYPTSTVTASQVITGTEFYNPNKAYSVSQYSLDVVAGNKYEVISVLDPEGVNEITFLNSFIASTNGVRTFGINNKLVTQGTKFRILSIITVPSAKVVSLLANYYYNTQNEDPTSVSSGQIAQGNKGKGRGTFLVHNFDDNNIDQSAFLLSLEIGDIISVGTGADYSEWSIQSIVVEASYFHFTVSPEAISALDGILQFSFYTVSSEIITIVNDVNYWNNSPFSGFIKGLLGIDVGYNNLTVNDTARNISMVIQEVTLSEDWDVVASSTEPISTDSYQHTINSNEDNISVNGELATFIPAGYSILGIRIIADGINNNEYINIGTSLGGSEVGVTNVTASFNDYANINDRWYSKTNNTSLFISNISVGTIGLEFHFIKGIFSENSIIRQLLTNVVGDDKGVRFLNQVEVVGELICGVDSYAVPKAWHCKASNTSDNVITGAIDVTAELQSDEGIGVGFFGGIASGDFLLVMASEVYEGVKIKYDVLGTVAPANIAAEFYENIANKWQEVSFMSTNSNYPHETHAWNISVDGHSAEQVFFGYNPLTRYEDDSWELVTFTINGTNYTGRFARMIVNSDIVLDPIIQQIKLHTDRIENESTGRFLYGRGRQPLELDVEVVPNSLNDPVNENVKYTQTATAKYVDNELASAASDGFLCVIKRKHNLDTSVPVVLEISGYVKGTGTGDMLLRYRTTQITDDFVYDGLADEPIIEELVSFPVSNKQGRITIKLLIPVNTLEANSAVLVEVSRIGGDALDTLPNNFVRTYVNAIGAKWRD